MATLNLHIAAAWLAAHSTPTRAFALSEDLGSDGTVALDYIERQDQGKGKRKGKGKDNSTATPRYEPAPGVRADALPILGPGSIDAPTDRTANNSGMDGVGNGAREGVAAEEQPTPLPPDNSLQEPPHQEPPPPPPPGEEPPPPPTPPPPETQAPPPTPPSTSVEVKPSTTSSLFVTVPPTERPPIPIIPPSLPTPARSFPPPSLSRPSLNPPSLAPRPSSPPHFSQPSRQPPPPPRQSSSAPVIISVAPSPPFTTNPPSLTPPTAQPTDAAGSRSSSPAPAAPSSTSLTDQQGAMAGSRGFEGDRSLVIALSTVLSVLGVVLVVGTVCLCYRYRYGRLPLSRRGPFSRRGITPIDDEEIESWKANRGGIEKATTVIVDKHDSASSIRKPPSVIVYQNHNKYQPRTSDDTSPRSLYHKRSMDKKSIDVPHTPVIARAPNARVGLTDDVVEGDLAFLPSPKRQNSRLSKLPPLAPRHGRHRSSRSSASVGSLRDHWFGYQTDVELSPRTSADHYAHMPSSAHSDGRHQRIYSDSSNPPRLSLDEDYRMGGLSPRPHLRQSEIGIAVG